MPSPYPQVMILDGVPVSSIDRGYPLFATEDALFGVEKRFVHGRKQTARRTYREKRKTTTELTNAVNMLGYAVTLSRTTHLLRQNVPKQVYTAFDTHLDGLGVYKLDTVGDAFVVVAGLDGFKSKEVRNLASSLVCSFGPLARNGDPGPA